jgi:hypothetical protein
MKTLLAIMITAIATGSAKAEGRTPSHDGEFVTIYSIQDGSWIGSSNGGAFGEDDLLTEEGAEMLSEIREAVNSFTADKAVGEEIETSADASALMIREGWIIAS